MQEKKRLISYILIMSMIIIIFGPVGYEIRVKAAQTGQINATSVYFRETPGGNPIRDGGGNTIFLNVGQALTIEDTTNSSWYKVSLAYDGVSYTGYVSSQFITIDEETSTEETPPSDTTTDTSDSDFESKLSEQKFPESYKVMLRELHSKYPSWEFKAIHTGLDWSSVIAGEVNNSTQIKNLIQGTSMAPHYSWRSITVGYNYKNDTWSPYDGSCWYAASDDIISYYLDPRTYLYESYIFVFENLSYVEGIQNEIGVEAILKGTFMSEATPEGEKRTYAQIIMEAGKTTGVSPYHIASRIKQEMGSTGGVCAFGNSESYPGIYNFYNIGAYDGADAVTNGLKWAATEGSYGRPWDTAAKSIIGGAEFLGTSYIKVSQDTLYTQKFNVTNTNCLYSHQYMTNVQAPASESLICYTAYKDNNLLNSTMEFKIPVYNNMPESAVAKPVDGGNPNNWLKTLSISGYTVTPTFDVSMTTEYSLIVPNTTTSIDVSATPVNNNASVSGTGTISLDEGNNVVQIVVTAQNGSVRTYTLTVVRQAASGGEGTTTEGTTGTEGDAAPQPTVSKGDLNGDGKISAIDIVKIQRIIVGLDELTADNTAIGDLNGDGKISAIDIVFIQRHIVGIALIQ